VNIGYLVKRIAKMNYNAFFGKLASLHNKTGKSKLFLLWDMLNCAMKYGAGYMDYDLFEMYTLAPAQRNTYITRGRNNALVRKYNDKNYVRYFDNKAEFNTRFSGYIQREWICLDDNKEDVINFIRKRDVLIAKPVDGACGKGIQKIVTSHYPDAQSLYTELQNAGQRLLLEDLIIQHPQISEIYPLSVNTLRVVTIRHEGKTKIVCTYFRIGNNSSFVDNFNSAGMVAPVDELTGIVKDKAIDKNKTLYEIHPFSGKPVKGFSFPFWKEAIDMVKRAACVVPQIGYVGWDVAFTPNGPCLIEGNPFPGHDIYQLPQHTVDKRGVYEKFMFDVE